MDPEDCLEESKIERAEFADCYTVFVAPRRKFVGSPTDTLTSFRSRAACFGDLADAESALRYHCKSDRTEPAASGG
jgi:hypothetical protein